MVGVRVEVRFAAVGPQVIVAIRVARRAGAAADAAETKPLGDMVAGARHAAATAVVSVERGARLASGADIAVTVEVADGAG